MAFETLMGDEAIALGAVHAGLGSAYAYPGTPSTEIMEWLQERAAEWGIVAQWCSNEKTAYESSLGASFAGRRAMVSMKHVGLNVAADPFINSALIKINGGLVVVVADDPGMHSSQDEQDSRFYAEFARLPCFEPSDQQEAYDMAREAFALSERMEIPVMIRVTTRLAHSRAGVETRPPEKAVSRGKAPDPKQWILMPAIARKRWVELLGKRKTLQALSEEKARATLSKGGRLGVITTGLTLRYYLESLPDMKERPSHLHVGFYPIPRDAIRALAASVDRILVVEDGYPMIERELRGLLESPLKVMGKETGELPMAGELDPDNVRQALGLPVREGFAVKSLSLPGRPPQLCPGCPHADSYAALLEALKDFPARFVASDIGCYTLGALPPFCAIESTVDMGASVGMARGAAEAGLGPTVAVIGDSTFYHSGIPNLVDAVSHNTSMTVLILDNGTTGMTGAQPTIMPSSRLEPLLKGIGVDPAHVRVIRAHKSEHEKNVAVLREELSYQGPSVVVAVRECLEALKKARKA